MNVFYFFLCFTLKTEIEKHAYCWLLSVVVCLNEVVECDSVFCFIFILCFFGYMCFVCLCVLFFACLYSHMFFSLFFFLLLLFCYMLCVAVCFFECFWYIFLHRKNTFVNSNGKNASKTSRCLCVNNFFLDFFVFILLLKKL